MATSKKTTVVKKRISKKEMEGKKALAYRLYMSGDEQKTISESIGVSEKTVSNWVNDETDSWKKKRSATIITRDELVKKILNNINTLLDESLSSDDTNHQQLADTLIKMSNSVEKLDRNNVVNDMQTFMRFNNYLVQIMPVNPTVTSELVKQINTLQNNYITSRMED
jgi:predicted transcriptional regulator